MEFISRMRRRQAGGLLLSMLLTGILPRRGRADETVEVKIDNFVFNPKTVTVKAGTMVRWVNHDDIPHSVLFPLLKLRSTVMDTDESYIHRFDQPGNYDYVCGIHPHMKATLIVTA